VDCNSFIPICKNIQIKVEKKLKLNSLLGCNIAWLSDINELRSTAQTDSTNLRYLRQSPTFERRHRVCFVSHLHLSGKFRFQDYNMWFTDKRPTIVHSHLENG
jgi:hypothetical protein